jgi:hypothetical protein
LPPLVSESVQKRGQAPLPDWFFSRDSLLFNLLQSREAALADRWISL